MNSIYKVFLILHIIGGSLGLLSGLLNILRKKGNKNHKLVGKIFFISMLTAGISSLILAYIHPNYFLFIVGVFTIYMVCSGQLYLNRYNNRTSKQIELIVTMSMFLAGFLFIGKGILVLIKVNLFGLVFLTFGCLGLLFVYQDFKNHQKKSEIKNNWLVAHLQRMSGAFIAALTAFLVVNEHYFPEEIPSVLYWLLPTIFVTPLIIKWSRKYQIQNK